MNPDAPQNLREEIEVKITAMLMGELSPEDAAAFQKQIDADPALARLHARLRQAHELLREACAISEQPANQAPIRLSGDRREKLLAHFKAPVKAEETSAAIVKPKWNWKNYVPLGVAALLIAMIGGALFLPRYEREGLYYDMPARGQGEQDFANVEDNLTLAPPAPKPASSAAPENEVLRRSTRFAELSDGLDSSTRGVPTAMGGRMGGTKRALVDAAAPAPTGGFGGLQNAPAKSASAMGRRAPIAALYLGDDKDQAAHDTVALGIENDQKTFSVDREMTQHIAAGLEKKSGEKIVAATADDSVRPLAATVTAPVAALSALPQLAANGSVNASAPATPESAPQAAVETAGRVMRPAKGEAKVIAGTDWEFAPGAVPPAGPATNDRYARGDDFWTKNKAADSRDKNSARGRDNANVEFFYEAGKGVTQNRGTAQPDGAASTGEGKAIDPKAIDSLMFAPAGEALGFDAGDKTQPQKAEPTPAFGDVPILGKAFRSYATATDATRAKQKDAPTSKVAGIESKSESAPALRYELADEPEREVPEGLELKSDLPAQKKFAGEIAAKKLAEARDESKRAEQSADGVHVQNERLDLLSAVAKPEENEARIAGKPTELAKLEKHEEQIARKDSGEKPAEKSNAEPPPIPQPEIATSANAFSTFSLNVSDVSFKLAAASLENGKMPEPATVRSEEFVNAFDYRDPEPAPGAPLAFVSERARYPFAQNRDLLRFAVKTAAAGREPGRALNIVLVLDKSGSMERADRVNIVHEALRVLAAQLQPQDKLSVVTFARSPRLWADGVAGDKAAEVVARVGEITPEGGTNFEAALDLGYATALRHYAAGSTNRVVLFTDGAANLGDVNPDTLKKKVEANRKKGVALDCFGIGWEGYDDAVLEALSRNGDGRYGFINTPEEAATGFAAQLAGALHVAASDVKVQIEWNPRRVTSWRQIGYAKHQLKKEDFRDNTVDAAEIGAAESGNALYVVEVNPRGEGDLATVRVRFKVPGTSDYREHEWTVPFSNNAPPLEQASPALRLAGTASAFSEWLVASPYATEVTPDQLLALLNGVPAIFGADPRPQKLEWMIRTAKSVSGR